MIEDMAFIAEWKKRARYFIGETLTLYYAVRDPRTPWYAKLVATGVVAYALNPIDLIPDFVPVLGYLDDIILIPLGVALVIKLIPAPVLIECRERVKVTRIKTGAKKFLARS